MMVMLPTGTWKATLGMYCTVCMYSGISPISPDKTHEKSTGNVPAVSLDPTSKKTKGSKSKVSMASAAG